MRLTLTDQQKNEMFDAHLPHRLTLLRSFVYRKKASTAWAGEGDIYRCLKDSALISIRMLLNAMGLKGVFLRPTGPYLLQRYQFREKDDVGIDQLGGKLVDPTSLTPKEHRLLAGLYCRADKELAHVTTTYNKEFNTQAAIIRGTILVTKLIKKHLYDEVYRPLPPLTLDSPNSGY